MTDKMEKVMADLKNIVEKSNDTWHPQVMAMELQEICEVINDPDVWDIFHEKLIRRDVLRNIIIHSNLGILSKLKVKTPENEFFGVNIRGEYIDIEYSDVYGVACDIEAYLVEHKSEIDEKQLWKLLAERLDEAYKYQDAKEFIQKLVDISREFNNEDIANCLDRLVPASYVYEEIKKTSNFKELTKLVGCISDWNCEWFMETKTLDGRSFSDVTRADIISFTYKLEMLADREED